MKKVKGILLLCWATAVCAVAQNITAETGIPVEDSAIILSSTVKVFPENALVEIAGKGGTNLQFRANLKSGDDWKVVGLPGEQKILDLPSGEKSLEIIYPIPENRDFVLNVQTFAEGGALVVGKIINRGSGVKTEYYFWDWQNFSKEYSGEFGTAQNNPNIWSNCISSPWYYLPVDDESGLAMATPYGTIGRSPGETAINFHRPLLGTYDIKPGQAYVNGFAVKMVSNPEEAKVWAMDSAVREKLPPQITAGAIDYGPQAAPGWVVNAPIAGGWYRPSTHGDFWSEDFVSKTLVQLPFVIGSQPTPTVLERFHRHGGKLIYYVIYVELLNTQKQVAGDRGVYPEWYESVLSNERDLANHPEWVCIDEKGKERWSVFGQQCNHPGLFYTCFHQEDLQAAALRQIRRLMEMGYDGIFVDLAAPVQPCFGDKFGVHQHAEPEKSNTEKYYELLDAIYREVKSFGNDRIVILNGGVEANFPRADVVMWETIMYDYHLSKDEWVQSPEELVALGLRYRDAEAAGKKLMPLVYLNRGENLDEQDMIHRAVCSYAYTICFNFCWTDYMSLYEVLPEFAQKLYQLDLGKPAGQSKRLDNGLWYRDFAFGKVFWNPAHIALEAELSEDEVQTLTDFVTGDALKGNKIVVPSKGGRIFVKK